MKIRMMIHRNLIIIGKSIRMNKILFVLQLLQIVIDNALLVINLIMPKYIIQAIWNNKVEDIIIILLVVFFFNLFNGFLNYKISPYLNLQNEKMNIEIVNSFLSKSYSLKIAYFDDAKAYDNYSIVFDHCCDIFHNAKQIFLQFISAVLQIFLVVSVMNWIDIRILVILLLIVFINLCISNKYKKVNYLYQKDMVEQNRQLNYLYRLFYIPQFIRDMRVNSMKKYIFNKKDEYSSQFLNKLNRNNKEVSKLVLLSSILSSFENVIVMTYFIYECFTGKIWIDDFFVATNAYGKLKEAIESILLTYTNLFENDLYVKDYLDFMNNINIEDEKGIIITKISSVEFRNVSFRYPNQEKYSLKNFSFKVSENEKVAFVGGNGAGKTTIVKLLLKLYEIEEGCIFINNIEINEYNLYSLRNQISVLFQDYSLYPFSIRDNIILGREINDKELLSALKRMNMSEFINALPLMLETPITSLLSKDGIELSGGESQRIALLRILIRESEMVVLDEPSSNLDKIIEKQLINFFVKKKKGMVIIITHNLVFASKMEKIICIKEGELAGEGTHAFLSKNNDYYKELYESGKEE